MDGLATTEATREIRFSYRQAAELMDRDRKAVAEIARSRGLEKTDGKPLTVAGFKEIARILCASSDIPNLRGKGSRSA